MNRRAFFKGLAGLVSVLAVGVAVPKPSPARSAARAMSLKRAKALFRSEPWVTGRPKAMRGSGPVIYDLTAPARQIGVFYYPLRSDAADAFAETWRDTHTAPRIFPYPFRQPPPLGDGASLLDGVYTVRVTGLNE